uniref:Maf-like protein CV_0124 n=2 Tax=Zea mays TaxID=4577 RepID=A0A804MV59_MAIZE
MATAGSSPPASQQPFKLILGSSSVARKHILEEMGLEFQVMTADIDEKSIRRENPDDLVMVLAEAKADAIMSRLNIDDYQKEGSQPTLLITSDIVYFHDIPDEVIKSLIDEGVVFRVAGGLLLEHPLTLPFVEAVVGSSDSVMGLSKEVANKLIHDALST